MIPSWLEDFRARVDAELERRLTLETIELDDAAGRLREAIRYAALGPGKRLRPALVVAAAEALGGDEARALAPACAVELLHAYTLVHDDLPAMDDDDTRRGQPTVHIAFGEGLAILAGDALLTEAFASLADLGNECAPAVRTLAERAGACQLLAGQARDLEAAETTPGFDQLEVIHRDKTGALFAASAELGAIAARGTPKQVELLGRIGMAAGIAFQHGDDRLDDEFPEYRARSAESVKSLAAAAEQLASELPGDTNKLRELLRCIALR